MVLVWRHIIDLSLKLGWNWLDFSSSVETILMFLWRIEFDFVLVSKAKCFFVRGIYINSTGRDKHFLSLTIDGLCSCVGGVRNGLGFWKRAANRLVIVWGLKWTWFLSRWSILTWFQSRASNVTWFSFRGRNLHGLCHGVENGFVSVCGSQLAWIDFVSWCSTAHRYGALARKCVCYVLEYRWLISSLVYPS